MLPKALRQSCLALSAFCLLETCETGFAVLLCACRAQSLMVCKKLCEVGEQSALLWQTVAWTPGTAYNMSSMLRWLVAHNSKVNL